MSIQQYNPPHNSPHSVGFIKHVYLEPFGLSSNEVVSKFMVSPSTFNRLINEKSDISPEMALKLSRVLGRSPESWLLMQDNYNLWHAKNTLNLSALEAIKFA